MTDNTEREQEPSATIETGMYWDEHEFEEVSHWMPLPQAPKERA